MSLTTLSFNLLAGASSAGKSSSFSSASSKYGFALVFPDTSPRNTGIAGEDDVDDLGTGSGHYLDATQEPWSRHYNMFSYVHKELWEKLAEQFPKLDTTRASITGHSMGGGGAISGFLKNPGKYLSVSAFAPLSNPLNAPLGIKNFMAYLGSDKKQWEQYDPVYLIKQYTHEHQPDILIHMGLEDEFYIEEGTLQPENFVKAAEDSDYKGKADLRVVEGYDHLYFFVSSFAEEHAIHHAKALGLI